MERLRICRIEKGYTQSELGKEIGVVQTAIGKYERGELEPNISILTKLADFFGCTIDYLVGREDDFGNVTATAPSSDLSEDEKKVLNLFKRMPEARQRTVLDLLEGLSDDGAERDGEKRRA